MLVWLLFIDLLSTVCCDTSDKSKIQKVAELILFFPFLPEGWGAPDLPARTELWKKMQNTCFRVDFNRSMV